MIKKTVLVVTLLSALIGFVQTSYAVIEAVEFETKAQERRYKDLIDQLRCLVCQNQNLAGSDAPLAKDLRDITANMIKQGDSDATIKAFMRERYGDFVLYEPPFNWSTAFLWLGPIVLLVFVSIGLILNIKRRQEDEIFKPTRATDDAERVKVRNLLRDTPSIGGDSTAKPSKPQNRKSQNSKSKSDKPK